MKIRNMGVRVALACVLAWLAGCVAAPPTIGAEQKLTGQEGAVVFKFIANGNTTADPSETLSSIILKREVPAGVKETAQDTAVLSRTRAVTNSTAVFSGMVAPGRYHVSHAMGFRGNVTYTFPMGNGLGRFEVKKGEVTLLGTLLVQPLEGRQFVVGYVPPDPELTETFEALFPALAQQTRGKAVHTMESTPELQHRESFASNIRRVTTAHNDLHAEPDGTVLAGGKMGRILWRKAGDSHWRRLELETWKEVLSVRMYRGGLLAAGEEGLLRYSTDDGRTWQRLAPPAEGLVAAAAPMPNGKVIALVRRDTQWTAYVTDDLVAGHWRKIGSFEQARSLNLPWQNAIPLASGSRVGVMMPNGEFPVVDGNSEALERHATGVTTFGAHVAPDGTLMVRGGTLTPSTLVSKDGGKTWSDLGISRFTQAIAFADARTAYAIAPVDPGLFAGTFALMVSHDGAKTWKKSGEVPDGTPRAISNLLYDKSDGSLIAFMQNGEILRSGDEGKTWTRSL